MVGSILYQDLYRRLDLKPRATLPVRESDGANLPRRDFMSTLSILSSRMTRYVIFGLFYIPYAQLVPNCKALNIVECPEFRQLLLLLCNDLQDSQIPHRTKLRELVLQAWSQYFQALRRDLAACSLPSFLTSSQFVFRLLWGRYLLRWIRGLIKIIEVISPSLPTGLRRSRGPRLCGLRQPLSHFTASDRIILANQWPERLCTSWIGLGSQPR